jgi:autotransporter-associated beta strand protein
MTRLCTLIILSMLVGFTLALPLQATVWTGGDTTDPTEFQDPDNWGGTYPAATTADISNATNPTAILDGSPASDPASVSRLYVGYNALGKFYMTDRALKVTDYYLYIGYNSNGAVYHSGGTLEVQGTSYARFGYNSAGYGYYSLSGTAYLNKSSGSIIVGNSGSSVFDQSGGSISVASNFFVSQQSAGSGVFNQTGGILSCGHFAPVNVGYAVANIAGTVNVTGTTPASQAMVLGGGATGNGTASLQMGGLVRAPWVKGTAGSTASLNFHGGTLEATLDDAPGYAWLDASLNGVYIYSEGATIDTGTHNVTAAEALLAPTAGVGIAQIELSDVGAGYIGAPVVKITAATGNGVGAAAVANVDVVTGVLTGVTVVNPGFGYADGDTVNVQFIGGGYSRIAAGTVKPNTVANSSGGLTKKGAGRLTLAATNTYAGDTVVQAGTLALASTGSIANSSTINVGAGSFFDVLAYTTFGLGGAQTLKGNGTVTGNVAAAAGSRVQPGASIGTLTVTGDLTVGGALDVEYNSATDAIDLLAVSGTLDLFAAMIQFSDLGSGVLDQPAYVFATYGTLAGTPVATPGIPTGYSIDYHYNNENKIALVPEPSSCILLLLAGLILAFRRCR